MLIVRFCRSKLTGHISFFTMHRFLLFFFISSTLFAQQKTSDVPIDTLSKEEAYQKKLAEMQRIRRLMENDLKGYMDSIRTVKEQLAYEAAVERIARYKHDPKLLDIKELDLSDARLQYVPEFVFGATGLEVLVLDNNQITELPPELASLPNLRRIYWKNNGLGERHPKIPRLSTVTKLDLSNNKLEKLPAVHRLDGLEELVLENNYFSQLPTWRGRRLKELKELDMSGNPVVFDRRWYWLLKNYKILKLNKCNLTAIHPSFYRMSGLEELQLQVNNLSEIPDGISRLSKMTKISFYKNHISQLPTDFFELSNLQVIDLYYNEFERIPEEMGNLSDLNVLYLSFNEIYDIPTSLGSLSNLKELYIHHNRISELPTTLSKLSNLRVLHFQENYISDFPDFLTRMERLSDVDISATQIQRIPESISQLDLEVFYWRDLDINFNESKNRETRSAIFKLQEKGTRVVPSIELTELDSGN